MPDKKNTIGRFEITEKIGEGPIGAVYKALDPVIRRTVAIKVIKLYALEETTTFAEIFEKIYRVVRTSTSLNHPNICIIYDLSEEKKIPYITMEYVEGHDIDSLLKQKHQFKRGELINILQQTCDALDFAHKKNVIHQDLKAANILVTSDLHVKITDFGIAGLDEIAAAQTKKLLSIPYYISPEQALGERVSPGSDLFSLGVVIYQLLSGQLPFPGTSAANTIMMIARDTATVPAELNRSSISRDDWNSFFNIALAKSPNQRFRSAREMLEALNSILPASDQTYYPFAFESSINDSTGKFEKTYIAENEMASPTLMIDASALMDEHKGFSDVPLKGEELHPFLDAGTAEIPQDEERETGPVDVVEPVAPEIPLPEAIDAGLEEAQRAAATLEPTPVAALLESQKTELMSFPGISMTSESEMAMTISPFGQAESSFGEARITESPTPDEIATIPPVQNVESPMVASDTSPIPGRRKEPEPEFAPPTQLMQVPAMEPPSVQSADTIPPPSVPAANYYVEPEPPAPAAATVMVQASHFMDQGIPAGDFAPSQSPLKAPDAFPFAPPEPQAPATMLVAPPAQAAPATVLVTPSSADELLAAPTKLMQGPFPASAEPPVQDAPVAAPVYTAPAQEPPRPQPQIRPQPKPAARPPGMQRYMWGAVAVVIFITVVGGGIFFFRKPVEDPNPVPVPSTQGLTGTVNPVQDPPPVVAVITSGTLMVTSEPTGATVLVMGEDKGVTPLEIPDLAIGKHMVKLQLQGYQDLEQEIEITADNPSQTLPVTLEKTAAISGTVVVQSEPPGAFIVIGNRVLGVTPKNLSRKPGNYTITLKKEGYVDYVGTVTVKQDQQVNFTGALQEVARPVPVVETPKPKEPEVTRGQLVTLGADVIPPKPIKKVYAKYPETAKAKRLEGTVRLNVLVDETGRVIDIKVTKSAHPLLDEAVVKAYEQWEFEAATKQGVQVKVWITVSMSFQSGR